MTDLHDPDFDDGPDDGEPDGPPSPALLDAAQLQLRTAVEQLLTPEHVTLDRRDADPALDDDAHLEIARLDIVTLGLAIRARAAHADGQRARAHTLLDQIERARTRQNHLRDAIRARRIGTGLVPPLLARLVDAVAASSNTGGAPSAGWARSVLGLQAAHIVADIAVTTRWGRYATSPHPDLLVQVRRWAARASWWRVVHPRYLLDVAPLAQWWVDQARATLESTAPLTILGACPACGTRMVAVDDAGWSMQQPALQVDRLTGITRCAGCSTTWPHERFDQLILIVEQERAAAAAAWHATHRADTARREARRLLDRHGITDPADVDIVAAWLLTGHAHTDAHRAAAELDTSPGEIR